MAMFGAARKTSASALRIFNIIAPSRNTYRISVFHRTQGAAALVRNLLFALWKTQQTSGLWFA
jgi:hypothetical protein